MIRNTRQHLQKYILFILFISCFNVAGQNKNELGFPPIANYSPKDYKAAPNNWSIIQDRRGILYFANNAGVLEYDGETWRQIEITNKDDARSLALDSSGRIYVGATNEFGYLSPDSAGRLEYISLIRYLDKDEREFGSIYETHVTPSGVYFQARTKIFLWDGERITTWGSQSTFHKLFYVNNTLFVQQNGLGLFRLNETGLALIEGGELFATTGLSSMIPGSNGKILIATAGKGLFFFTYSEERGKSRFVHLPSDADPLFKEKLVSGIVKLNDSLYSLATWGAGIILIDGAGNFIQQIGKEFGLQDAVIEFQYVDDDGNLWLALSNGISNVQTSSPITIFNDRNGLEGTVEAITRFNDKIYAATKLGVYYLSSHKGPALGSSFPKAKFISLSNGEAWHLLSCKNEKDSSLLVALNDGVYEIMPDHSFQLISKCYPWILFQSRKNPSRVYVGLDDGLLSIYRHNGKWYNEGVIEEVTETVRNISEDNEGNIWLGTQNQGLIKITQPGRDMMEKYNGTVVKYGKDDGLPEGAAFAHHGNKWSIISTEQGIYRQEGEKFVQDTIFRKGFNESIHRLNEDKKGNIWMVTVLNGNEFEVGMLTPSIKSVLWSSTPFLEISKDIIHSIYHDGNNISWLGGPNGIYRYDGNIKKDYKKQYPTAIRKVTLGEDSVIFWGAFRDDEKIISSQPEDQRPVFSYKNNSITFHFSTQSYQNSDANLYSYFLEGFDKAWTEWKPETKAVYTNLPEGDYVFRVKARNIFKNESTEAVYKFSILSPWYRTAWAYIAYVLLFVFFVYGAVTISTRSLRSIIKERTAEIVQQKELVEHKNKDIMDSINYAKRIQTAILPSDDIIEKALPDSMILYKPKDIVSGDFYWFTEKKDKVFIAAADCTGHGVPGAFMSMIGNSLLNEIVNEKNITEPDEILNNLRAGIIRALKQTGAQGESKDGMDIALISLQLKPDSLSADKARQVAVKLRYAGANNPLYIIRKNGNDIYELSEIKGDKQPIGIYGGTPKPFTKHEVELKKGDAIYIFTDGYADQFGGEKGKKFKYSQLKELLLAMQNQSMNAQKRVLENTIEAWKGDHEQIDDICVIGVKV